MAKIVKHGGVDYVEELEGKSIHVPGNDKEKQPVSIGDRLAVVESMLSEILGRLP